MADPLASMEKIVKVAFMIKQAVETVRHNKKECIKIVKSVSRITALLSRLQDTGMMEDPSMSDALEDLDETLRHAHTIVTACQERNIMCHFCRAGYLSKQLRQVQDDILQKVMLGVFATTVQVTITLANIPYPRPPEDAGEVISYDGDSPVDTRSKVSSEPSESSLTAASSSSGLRARPATIPRPTSSRLSSHASSAFSASRAEENVPAVSEAPLSCFSEFSLSELEAATNNFSEEFILGQGGFAIVYKGVLSDGLVVAIKKFHISSLELSDNQLGGDELRHLFSMPEHKNIVRVLGYCRESRETSALHQGRSVLAKERFTLLVKEYAPNGTLEKIIKGPQLDWSSRFRIIQGIAQGVHFLHSAEEPILHLDLKPGNILLDSDMNPKIDDFGIARLMPSEGTKTQNIVGTIGYLPPEYIMDGAMSAKNDVYSFGMILLETISGMRKSEDSKPALHHASIAWAWAARKARRMNELFDPSLCEESQLKGIKRCMEIGLLCTQENPRDRPTMAEVVEMLNGEKKLPTPKQPGYTKDRS